jgi:hypothetical protein
MGVGEGVSSNFTPERKKGKCKNNTMKSAKWEGRT